MTNSEQMLLALEQQNLEQAMDFFHLALTEDSSDVLLELGDYLEGIGFLPQAQAVYQKLVADYPELHLNLARIAHEDGDTDTAFAELEYITADSPYYVEALLVKADFYQSEGLTDVAYEKLLEAVRLSDDPIILFGLAELELELGRYREAVGHYAQLDNRVFYNQTGVSTYQRIGICYASLGKFEAATEFLEKAVELEYDDQTVFELATLLMEREEYQKANLYFKQLDTINPDFEGYEYAYALSLHAEHRLDMAVQVLRQGLAKNQYDAVLLKLAAQYAYEQQDSEQAEKWLLAALNETDVREEIVLPLTSLYLEQERFEDVLAFAEETVDNLLIRWNIAKAYQALDREKEALSLFSELAQDLKENPDFLSDYILLLRQTGQVTKAKEYAKHYIRFVPDDMEMNEFFNQG